MSGTAPLSVLIATHNGADTLPQTLRAVLDQDLPAQEIVVVDDGSTDETPEVVRAAAAEGPVRLVQQANAGIGAARNAGAAAADREWLVFLDDDDVPDPWWLRSLWDARNAGIAGSVGARMLDLGSGQEALAMPKDMGPAFFNFHGRYLAGTFIVARHAFDEVAGFDPTINASHQTEFALRLTAYAAAHGHDLGVTDRPALTVRQRPVSDRSQKNAEKLVQAAATLLDRHGEQLSRDPRVLANTCAVAGVACVRLGRSADARRYFARAARAGGYRSVDLLRLGAAAVPPLARRVWPPTYRTWGHDVLPR